MFANDLPKLGGWIPASTLSGPRDPVLDRTFEDNVGKFGVASVPNDGLIDLRKWCSPVENQRELSSCTANSIVGALEYLQIYNGQPYVDLSRLFVYYNTRLATQNQEQDNGSVIHYGFFSLTTIGVCAENNWPYDVTKVTTRPSWAAYRDAYANKIGSYYSIATPVGRDRNTLIRHSLLAHHPVVFGMIVDRDYQTYSSGIVKMPSSNRVGSGGHCQMIVGEDMKNGLWLVRNSWGTSWGIDGYAWVPHEYLDVSGASDFWVATALTPEINNESD